MRQKLIKLSVLFISLTLLVVACKKEEPMAKAPEVGTLTVTNVTTGSFEYQGMVTADGGSAITMKGICYGTQENPTIADQKTTEGKGKGDVKGQITNLTPDKVYYARVYATNSVGTTYGTSVKVALQKQETLIGAEEAYPAEKKEVVTINQGGISMKVTKVGDKHFYQGDILIDQASNRGYAKRTAIDLESHRWKNNVFVYKIDPDFPDKQRIYDAFKLFEKTNITFKERTDEKNYALFKYIKGAGCYSYVGMIDEGEQLIVIDTWAKAGSVAHEIGHALGLKHEQSRPDRDKYVKIIEGNIKKGKEHNFDVIPGEWHPIALGDFDFSSIMLYHSWSFSVAKDKSKPTIVKLDGTTYNPQRQKLTEGDIEILNYLYPKLEDLAVEKEEVRLEVGKETAVKISTGNGNYTITSSDTNKATTTEKEGIITITAKAEGTATITVKDNKTEQIKTVEVIIDDLSTYIELTIAKAVGETIKLAIKSDKQDQKNIWIDLNNNRTKDDGEEVTKFIEVEGVYKEDFVNYVLQSQTIRVYGKVGVFHCSENQVTDLDVSKNTKLKELHCSDNQLSSLDLSNNTVLIGLNCTRNQLSDLDLSQNIKLVYLSCQNNKLNSLDVSHNRKLEYLYCENNQLKKLNISQHTDLKQLYCGYNQLRSLDVVQSTELRRLSCEHNQLSRLDVPQSTELNRLYCNNNQLSSLDISKNTKLGRLKCQNNQLSSLDVSKNTKLYDLLCANNQLTSLDVTYSQIAHLDCTGNNQLVCIKVTQEQLDNKVEKWKKDDSQTYNTNCN